MNNFKDLNSLATEFRRLKSLINILRMLAAVRTLNGRLVKCVNGIKHLQVFMEMAEQLV